MSLYHITSISLTQFRVELRDDATDTIVEGYTDFNKSLAMVSAGTSTDVSILDRDTLQGYRFFLADVVEPSASSALDLIQKLIPICTT